MSAPLTAPRAIALVAGREFQTQVQKKSFLISNGIILVAIVVGIVAMSIFGGGDEDRPTVGVVGGSSLSVTLGALGEATGSPLDISELPDAEAGRAQVTEGELDVALVPGDAGSITALTESDIDTTLKSLIDAAVAQEAQSAALTGRGVDPADIAAATAEATVTVEAIDPPDPEQGERMILAIVAVILLYMQILMFGMYVAMGVVEEKSSRVVELLLSTLRPLQLLWGKIFGIGAVGLLQLTATEPSASAPPWPPTPSPSPAPRSACSPARSAGSSSDSRSSRCSTPRPDRWCRVRKTSTPPPVP